MAEIGEFMKATGIVRRVDELGRIVLPKELRRSLGVSEGTPMEIEVLKDGIVLRKFREGMQAIEVAKDLENIIDDICVDLGPEKTSEIRRNLREIKSILKSQN